MSKSSNNKRREDKKSKARELKLAIKREKYNPEKEDNWDSRHGETIVEEKPVVISQARQNRLKLEEMCDSDLPSFISEIQYSNLFSRVNYKSEISAEQIEYSHSGNNNMLTGLKISKLDGNSWEFGFKLYQDVDGRNRIKVDYGPVTDGKTGSIQLYSNQTSVLPKNLNASKLIKLINSNN